MSNKRRPNVVGRRRRAALLLLKRSLSNSQLTPAQQYIRYMMFNKIFQLIVMSSYQKSLIDMLNVRKSRSSVSYPRCVAMTLLMLL